jgi:hypothetical protein
MKKLFLILLAPVLLQSCGGKSVCGDNCKKPQTYTANGSTATVVSDTSKGPACKLTSSELEKRKTDVLSVIKSKILERKELADGYSFKFVNSDENINMLTDFIKSERQCCDFFNFSIHVKNDGTIWFDLTGPKDAKEMIGQELAL